MQKKVFWSNLKKKKFLFLNGEVNCKFLIVGGGIAGVSLAYFLAKQSAKNVVLIEKNFIASGATGRAAGMLVAGMENVDIAPFLKKFGREKTFQYFQKQIDAYEGVKKIIRAESISCDAWEGNYFVVGSKSSDAARVRAEYRARKKLAQRVELLSRDGIRRELGTDAFCVAEKVRRFALSFNPMAYTQGLAESSARRGVRIYEHTPLLGQTGSIAKTPKGKIRFETIIYAVDSFFPGKSLKRIKTTIGVTSRISQKSINALRRVTPMMFEDDEKRDYHYVKTTPDNRILVGYGGVEVARGVSAPALHAPHLDNIKRFIARVFPRLRVKIEYAWSGIFASPARAYVPRIKFKKNKVFLLGSGTQIFSTMMAKYVATRLSQKKQILDAFFK